MAAPYGYTNDTGVQQPTLSTYSRFHKDFSEKVFNREAGQSTWKTRLGQMDWELLKSPFAVWDEESLMPIVDTVAADALTPNLAAVGTGVGWIPVTNISRWVTGTVARNVRTGEQVIVTDVNRNSPTSVYLGFRGGAGSGTVAAQAIVLNDTFQLLPASREEKSRAHESTMHSRTNYENYLELFSETLDMSSAMLEWKSMHGAQESAWDHEMALKEAVFWKKFLHAFFIQDIASPSISDNTRRIFGGVQTFMTNSNSNANCGGNTISKQFFKTWLNAWRRQSKSNQCDLVMATSLTGQFTNMFEDQVFFNDTLPKQIKMHVQSLQYQGITANIHAEDVLEEAGNNNIYLFDTSKHNGHTLIKMRYQPVLSGTKHTSGKPNWVFDQQDNDTTVKKAQLIANCMPQLIGGPSGSHGVCLNVGN